MATKEIEIRSNEGISLRIAAKIYKEIDTSGSKVILYKDGESADASSVIDVLALGVEENSRIKVVAFGNNEQRVIENVTEILTDGAGI